MTTIRNPAVAGTFYPDDPKQLRTMVKDFLSAAAATASSPKAINVPHAGYIYSGPIAASAYACVAKAADRIKRVVLLGPSHRMGFDGLAAHSAVAFVTPLGSIPVDRAAIETLLKLPQVHLLDEAHQLEHSLEVHLPFLQEILEDFILIPLAVGDAGPEEVSAVLDNLWGGGETLIVVSSDLSHYNDYETARKFDGKTAKAIEALRADDIKPEDACGYYPIRGLLIEARRHRMSVRVVDLRNSGDTAGPRDQVVGYGAFLFA